MRGARAEIAYETLFQRLNDRGLREPGIVVGEDSHGLWAAADTVFPFAAKQACLYHLWCELRNSCFKAGFDWTTVSRVPSGTIWDYHCRIHGSAGNGHNYGNGMVGVIVVR